MELLLTASPDPDVLARQQEMLTDIYFEIKEQVKDYLPY